MSEYPELNLSFINKGISGNTLKGLELRWRKDVLDLKPDHLFIMIGINDAAMQLDSARNDNDVLDEFEQTFEKLMILSLDKVMSIHCMTPFYINNDDSSPLLDMTLKYIERITHVCKTLDIPLLNIHDTFQAKLKNSEAEYWSGDGVHPYEHGHMLIARTLYNEVCDEI